MLYSSLLPMLFSFLPSTKGQYRLVCTLHGHAKSVFSLNFSVNGRFLASGGGDGLRLWDTRTYVSLRTLEYRTSFGPMSQVLWIPTRSGIPTICYETGLGYLCTWAQSTDNGAFTEVFAKRLGGGAEILGLACEALTPTNTRIVVSDRSRFVGVYSYGGHAELLPIFTVHVNHAIPISLSFVNTKGRELYKLSGTDGKILKTKSLSDKIGHACIQAKQQLLVVDNNLNGETHQRTFPTGKPTCFLPRQVEFVDDARAIVGGSDHGAVYVFDRKTGAPLDVLRHAQQGLIQTIATTKRDRLSLIASATSCGTGVILVWRARKTSVSSPMWRMIPSLGAMFRACMQALVLAVAITFCLQNFGNGFDLTMWVQSVAALANPEKPAPRVVRNHYGAHQVPTSSRHSQSRTSFRSRDSAMLWEARRTHVENLEVEDAHRAPAGSGWKMEDTRTTAEGLDAKVSGVILL
ncbi:WD40 repeat-like protein [Obba rivulosa]|uniref:WD40 repeat-like protein n=1 Tax=Obba rivulosa TaxID=1052685 RepID=A0A8E2AHM6_9APHY|nr:WD40 repeat-like protein [Obba rivulosa]